MVTSQNRVSFYVAHDIYINVYNVYKYIYIFTNP